MKQYKLAEIGDRGGDVSKEWYVYYYYLIPGTLRYCRFKIKGGINRLHVKSERMEAARALRQDMNDLLRKGFSPFEDLKPSSKVDVGAELNFGDAVKYYWEQHISHTGERSKQNYNWTMRMVLSVIEPTTLITMVKANMIREGLNKLHKIKRWKSNRTRNNVLQSINALFNFLMKIEEAGVKENPCRYVQQLTEEASTQNTPPTDAEFETIVRHLNKNNKQLLLAASFVLYAAIRTVELGKIQRKQIVTYNGNLAIRLSGARVKNKKNDLRLLAPDLVNLLVELGVDKLDGEDYLFSYDLNSGPKQWPSFRNRIAEVWKENVKDQLNIDVGIYSFKHYQAGKLAQRGVDDTVIQKWADHDNVKTTRNNYIRGNVPQIPMDMMNDFVRLPLD